jgi:hypothetical protein
VCVCNTHICVCVYRTHLPVCVEQTQVCVWNKHTCVCGTNTSVCVEQTQECVCVCFTYTHTKGFVPHSVDVVPVCPIYALIYPVYVLYVKQKKGFALHLVDDARKKNQLERIVKQQVHMKDIYGTYKEYIGRNSVLMRVCVCLCLCLCVPGCVTNAQDETIKMLKKVLELHGYVMVSHYVYKYISCIYLYT